MKKIIILSFVAVIVLSGCGLTKKQTAEKQSKVKKGGIEVKDASLMNWLKKGKSVTCEIETPDGVIKVMSKGEKVRIEGMLMASSAQTGKIEKGYNITDKDWMYTWSGKDGTKINLKKMDEIYKENNEVKKEKTWKDDVLDWEKQGAKYKCRETRLSDSIFVPPADVEFKDFTKMLDQMSNMGKQFQQTGGKIPTTNKDNTVQMPDMENIDMEAMRKQAEEMQKKYGQ